MTSIHPRLLDEYVIRSMFAEASSLLREHSDLAGEPALFLAIELRSVRFVRLLLQAGALNRTNVQGLRAMVTKHEEPEIRALIDSALLMRALSLSGKTRPHSFSGV